MAQYLTSSTARIGFVFSVDGEETAATSVSVTVTRPDATVVVTSSAATLLSGSIGTYYYDVSSTIISTYTGRWTQVWTAVYNGQTTVQTKYFTVGTRLSVWSMRSLRRKIAQSLRDYTLATCTAIGSSRQVIDTDRLYQDGAYFARAWVRSFSGTESNIGLERQAGSFDSGTLTLAQALATTTAVGDKFDIHRRWSFEEYREAINDAIASLFPKIYLPVVDDTSILTTAGDTNYDVSNLQYPIANLGWVEIETTSDRPWAPTTCKLDPDRAILRMDGTSLPGDKHLRIFYEARVPKLVNEFDVLECEESRTDAIIAYLTYKVPVNLYMMEIAMTPSTATTQAEALIKRFEDESKMALESARMRRLPGRVIPGNFGVNGYGSSSWRDRPGDYLGELVD